MTTTVAAATVASRTRTRRDVPRLGRRAHRSHRARTPRAASSREDASPPRASRRSASSSRATPSSHDVVWRAESFVRLGIRMRAVATRRLRSSSSVARRTWRETRARASSDPRATTTTTTAFARVMSANEETVDPSAMDATQSCQGACSRETPRLSATAIAEALQTRPLWRLTPEGTAIARRFTSKNWATAMAFLNQVSDVAEREGHHPDVSVKNYRDVEIVVGTHAIGGLSRFDFILAAKIDAECVATYSPKWARENGVA